MRAGLTIGQLADRCGVSREALRYYERERLLPRARRAANGYRLFDASDEARVRFVLQGQAIGLSLEDLRELLALRSARSPRECQRVAARLRARIESIDQRVAELRNFRRRLDANLRQCLEAGSGECPVSRQRMHVRKGRSPSVGLQQAVARRQDRLLLPGAHRAEPALSRRS